MKRAGDLCKMDSLGRIVIPVRLRRRFELKPNDSLEIFTEGDSIIMRKYIASCVFCGNEDSLKELKGKYVCSNCISKLSEGQTN